MRLYPTLIGQQTATPSTFIVGKASACHNLNPTGDTTFTWDSATIPGLQTGDLLVMTAFMQAQGTTGLNLATASNDWYFLNGNGTTTTGVMGDGACTLWHWYDSAGTTSWTFNSTPTADGWSCFQVRAYRGVSRRKPIDFIWRTEHDPLRSVGLPYTGMRAHGTDPIIVAAYHANEGDSTAPVGFMDFTASSMEWRATILDEWAKTAPLGANNEFGIWEFVGQVDKSTLQNITGLEYTFATDIPGWAFSTMQWDTAPSAASVDCDKDGFSSTSTSTVAHYLTATVNLAVDDVLIVCARHSGGFSNASAAANYYLMPALIQPDATTIGGRAANTDTTYNTSWDLDFDTVNPYPMVQYFAGSQGSAGTSYKMSGLVHRATQDGDHEIRLYACRATKALSWQVSTTGSEVAINLSSLGIGVSKNGSPPPMHTHKDPGSATEFASNDVVPVPIFMSSPDDLNGDFLTTAWSQLDQYQIVLEDATLLSTQLVRTNNVQPPLLFDDANKLNIDGTTQYRFVGDPWIVRADTVLLPTYRLTEGGADTDGQYYWEITVEETVSDASCSMGVAIPGSFDPESASSHMEQGFTSGTYAKRFALLFYADGDIEYVDNGRTNAWTTSGWTAGDIFSFALDIPAGTLGIYKNGVLLVGAIDLTTGTGAENAVFLKRSPWVFVAKLEDSPGAVQYSNDIIPITANFKGPFTYTKPVGYVAYDWPNEVA